MGDYRKLLAWKRSHELVLKLYRVTRQFPKEEIYSLTAQLRRAGVSVAANLAEGCGRNSDAEIARFARISMGSAAEVEYYLLLARDLGYIDEPEHRDLAAALAQIKGMLANLAASLTRSNVGPNTAVTARIDR
jgi:four helix bundle protein